MEILSNNPGGPEAGINLKYWARLPACVYTARVELVSEIEPDCPIHIRFRQLRMPFLECGDGH
jgi:hypothetical protein